MKYFDNVNTLYKAINDSGYVADKKMVYSIWFAHKLNKAILLQGPPGVGKTEIAKVVSNIVNGKDPIRLQMYEGIDSSQALYDWDYKKQLLYIESTKDKTEWNDIESNIYSKDFLLTRPLLKSIISDTKEVILIDEIDKSDEEFESMLLEFLAEWQITILEDETIKAKTKPICFITSNDKRELSEALLRRCITIFLDYPTMEQEIDIIMKKVPSINDLVATQIVSFVNLLREQKLKKIPSIAESIDWALTLVEIGANYVDKDVVLNTLNILLKYKKDIEYIEDNIERLISKIPQKPIEIDKEKTIDIEEIKNVNWDF